MVGEVVFDSLLKGVLESTKRCVEKYLQRSVETLIDKIHRSGDSQVIP